MSKLEPIQSVSIEVMKHITSEDVRRAFDIYNAAIESGFAANFPNVEQRSIIAVAAAYIAGRHDESHNKNHCHWVPDEKWDT